MTKAPNNSVQLGQYRSITEYAPAVSDFVVRCGWFRSYFGIVNGFNQQTGIISIVMEGTPRLLLTLSPIEVEESILMVHIDDVKAQNKGSWSICKQVNGQPVWYI